MTTTQTYQAPRYTARAKRSVILPTGGIDGDGQLVDYDAALVQLGGNSLAHFSLTGTIYTGTVRAEPYTLASGAIGDDIAELLPVLAPVARLHLSDSDGVPMHAVENGWYWLGFTKWVNWLDTTDQYGRALSPRAILAKHFRLDAAQCQAETLHDDLASIADEAERKAALVAWVDEQRPRWHYHADRALAVIRLGDSLPGRARTSRR